MQRFLILNCPAEKLLMRQFLYFLISTLAIFPSCTKKSGEPAQKCVEPGACNSNEPTTSVITNRPAVIYAVGGQFYIEYKDNIDTRLLPCNLGADFQIDGLVVTISGNVKQTVSTPTCCTENFEITSICK